ncbi:hypothetical protein BRC62_02765 [Halobacteriales archaeon QH_10_67_13]|nr:MAG: hypothetical protein BRC62_02765 [Halobacteriales archaeon QH_10_67_13]
MSDDESGTGGQDAIDERTGGQERRRTPQEPRQPVQQSGGQAEAVEYAKFGGVVFGLVAAGTFLALLLGSFIGDQAAIVVSGGQNELFGAVTGAFQETVTTLGVVAAAATAVYYARTDEPAQTAAAIATGAGALAVSVVFLLLMVVFEPSGGNGGGGGFAGNAVSVDIGTELPGVLGAVVGLAALAGAVGYVLEEDPLEVFDA